MTVTLVTLGSDEDAARFVGKRVEVYVETGNFARVVGLAPSDETYEGIIVRAHRRAFVLETDQGKVKCTWGQLRRELP